MINSKNVLDYVIEEKIPFIVVEKEHKDEILAACKNNPEIRNISILKEFHNELFANSTNVLFRIEYVKSANIHIPINASIRQEMSRRYFLHFINLIYRIEL